MQGLQRLRAYTPSANACNHQHQLGGLPACSRDAGSKCLRGNGSLLERRRTHRLASASAVAEPGTAARPVDVAHSVAHAELPAPDTGRCVNNYTSFTEQFRIRGYEAGPDQRANIITMANLLQVWRVQLGGKCFAGPALCPALCQRCFGPLGAQCACLGLYWRQLVSTSCVAGGGRQSWRGHLGEV